MSTEIETPEPDCSREQFEALAHLIADLRGAPGAGADQFPLRSAKWREEARKAIGIIDVTTYPFAEQHLLLCLAALDTAQRHAQLAGMFVSRGE